MPSPRPDTATIASGANLYAGRPGLSFNALVSIWGQSNATGRAERADISASPLSDDPGLATFDAGTFDRVWIWTGSASFSKLTPSTNNDALAGQFGPEFGLAVRWMRRTAGGDLYIIKRGHSGVSITEFEPTAGARYSSGRAAYLSAASWLSTRSIAIDVKGMAWVQGEADAAQTEAWYRTRLDDLAAAWNTDGILETGEPLVLAQMHPTTSSYGAGVYAAKAAFASENAGATAVVMPPYMKSDNLHQNGRGQVQMGYDYAAEILGLGQESV